MAGSSLTSPDDVETALLRPLTDTERAYIEPLIIAASSLLRNAAPAVDDRIARWKADSTDPTALDPLTVSTVLAGVVKRYLINPTGIATESETVGPFSKSTAYALRSEKESRGVLQITALDVATLFPTRKRLRAGTIRLRPALAPRPVGRYGPFNVGPDAIVAAVTFDVAVPRQVEATAFLRGDLWEGV